MYIGFHFSIQPSLAHVPINAHEFGCNTFQLFTRSNRQWNAKPLDTELAAKFRQNYTDLKFETSVIHLPYLPNFATSDPVIREKSLKSLHEEVFRANLLEIPNIVLHLGSHKEEGDEAGIKNMVAALDDVIPELDKTRLSLEISAGHPNSVGKNFEELHTILEKVSDDKKIGICMDTAHAFAANYDLRTPETVESVFESFDNIIGLNKLYTVHLNDSKKEIGSHLDRHEHIGKGKIGQVGFKAILKRLNPLAIPVIMETPKSEKYGDNENLAMVHTLLEDN